jgi:hypothetical protein
VRLDGSAGDVADVLDRHLDHSSNQEHSRASVAAAHSVRIDALRLYRKILRYSVLFDWPDERGELWKDKLRRNARLEFEASRLVQDAETTARLLVTGHQAVDQVFERYLSKRRALEEAGQLPRQLSNPYAGDEDMLHPASDTVKK